MAWAPIAALKDKARVDISNFWFYSRARPLMEFIPAPRPHIYAMVRGWYIGHLLGLIDNARENEPVTIVDPWDRNLHKYEFPYPTLSPLNDDYLASLLESLALAYVRVGIDDNVEPLYPYVLLRKLGTSGDANSLINWSKLNQLCQDWLRNGKVPGSRAEIMLCSDIANDAMSISERRMAAARELQSLKDRYIGEYNIWLGEVDASPTRLGESPLWPSMWDAMERSLTQIIGTFQSERSEMQSKKV